MNDLLVALAEKVRTVTTVIFDMDDVLCRLDDEKRIAYLHALCGMPHEEIAHAIWGSGFENRTDAGEFSAEEYLVEFGKQIGHPITRAQWCEYRKSGMTPITPMLEFAESLRETHKLGILTNNGLLLQEEIDTLFPELRPIFGENIFCSAQFRIQKPEPLAFLSVCSVLDAIPEKTLFIDDRGENVDGARLAGLVAFQFKQA